MILIERSLNPLSFVGLATHCFALVARMVAWVGDLETLHRRRLATALVVLEAALVTDMVVGGRWLLHNMLVNAAKTRHLYGERFGPQHAALFVLGILSVTGIGIAVWILRKRPGASLAVCGAILSLCCWWVEVISLHAIDRLLYQRIDGLMPVTLIWVACSLMTGIGILWDSIAIRSRASRAPVGEYPTMATPVS